MPPRARATSRGRRGRGEQGRRATAGLTVGGRAAPQADSQPVELSQREEAAQADDARRKELYTPQMDNWVRQRVAAQKESITAQINALNEDDDVRREISGLIRKTGAFSFADPRVPPKVIEYLMKKGYLRTEQTLRQESSKPIGENGKPVLDRAEDTGAEKYSRAYKLLRDWIKQCLDVYKPELQKLLWPLFVYSYLELIMYDYQYDAKLFLEDFGPEHEEHHKDELRVFATFSLPVHARENQTARLYQDTKYRLSLNNNCYFLLVCFLEEHSKEGGTVVLRLLSTYFQILQSTRAPTNSFGFEAIIAQVRRSAAIGEIEDGIADAFTGVSNKDMLHNNAAIKLGLMAMEPDLAQDVRAELLDEDLSNPPAHGQRSLVEEFDAIVKREETLDAPSRSEIPLPGSRARDVVMEIQKIKENRDRLKIESRTGGIGPALSVIMFTFHNSYESITCIELSDDTDLVAVGTQESYIRVWNLHGDPLISLINENKPPSASRRLIGHSEAVYAVSFSPSILGPKNADANTPHTRPILLLSSSADGTIRLWSLETWTCLAIYKGHSGPVWNVRWGPFGHYFVSCGRDQTARVWAQDRISYVRMMAGRDSSVNQIAWHPNGAYVFSASDLTDKTVRMWSVVSGDCVRVFAGHAEFISTLECSPNGKILASGDNSGTIILWDLAKGTMIKRCKGHGKGGIWSLSFSVESTCLVSGGGDGTVRIWDVELPADLNKNDDHSEVIGKGGQRDATMVGPGPPTQSNAATGSGSKKKGKDTTVTPDQISAFPTKKTPVFKVKFTRMNLVMAAGCFQP